MSKFNENTMSTTDLKTNTEKSVLDACAIDLDKLPSKQTKVAIAIGKQSSSVAFKLDPEQKKTFVYIVEKIESDTGEFVREDYYVVVTNLHVELEKHTKLITFHAGMTQYDQAFIYPEKIPNIDGYSDSWIASGGQLVKKAEKSWVRGKANFNKKEYEATSLNLQKRPITWFDFNTALNEALKSNIIDSMDHPVLKRLGIVKDDQAKEYYEEDTLEDILD
jgi:hypothetical protein